MKPPVLKKPTIPQRRARLKRLLEHNVMRLTFRKKDGERRKMLCTLREDMIPKIRKPKRIVTSKLVLVVFDLECSEWRCFRIKSILGKPFKDGGRYELASKVSGGRRGSAVSEVRQKARSDRRVHRRK